LTSGERKCSLLINDTATKFANYLSELQIIGQNCKKSSFRMLKFSCTILAAVGLVKHDEKWLRNKQEHMKNKFKTGLLDWPIEKTII